MNRIKYTHLLYGTKNRIMSSARCNEPVELFGLSRLSVKGRGMAKKYAWKVYDERYCCNFEVKKEMK